MIGLPQTSGELRAVLTRYRPAIWTIVLLSAVLNVLLLGGSMYMMLVYDSVLPSHSLPTLFGLLAMIIVVYVFQGVFDTLRSHLLSDLASDLDADLAPRVQAAISDATLRGGGSSAAGPAMLRDLDQVRTFLAGPGPGALIDLPWIFFFLAILFLLHVWLGVTALIGALVLIALTFMIDRRTGPATLELNQELATRQKAIDRSFQHIEALSVLGMRKRMAARWQESHRRFVDANDRLARSTSTLGNASKVFRMFLQSGILTVGALLVIDGKASGGIIFASSILAGRALAPVDTAIGNYRGFMAARLGWRRIEELLSRSALANAPAIAMPDPKSRLSVEGLVVAPPGSQRVAVGHAEFALEAGETLGLIGASAAGKTSLGRALVGAWPAARGAVRLDGATLDQWTEDERGRFIGYLPQTIELLEGSVADNIARFDGRGDSEAVIAAARMAGVHDMIVALPGGYDTPVGEDRAYLSAGQRQRVGLARALYRDPFLVVLDEPNSNLDAAGDAALDQAIASVSGRGGIAVIITHRTAALAKLDKIAVMREGRMEAFGPREEILRSLAPPTAPPPRPTTITTRIQAAR